MWRGEGVRVVDLETRASRLGDVQCAEYQGRIVDRRAPPGFVEQPFLVVLAGRVCPHPDAPSLVVEIGSSRRSPEGAPLPAADSAGGAFVASLALDAFRGPIVEAMLALRGDQEPQARDQPFWVSGAAMGGGSLWLSHTPGTLSRVDPVSLRITAAVAVGSPVAGFADGRLWGAAPLQAWLWTPQPGSCLHRCRRRARARWSRGCVPFTPDRSACGRR